MLTKERVRTLVWAVLISTVCLIGAIVDRDQPDGQADWPRWLFTWWPIRWAISVLPVVRAGSLHGARSAWYDMPLAFVLSVRMWWVFIEGGRALWTRVAR